MYLNYQTSSNLHHGTIKPEPLLAIASENGLQTLALTSINSTSVCLDLARLSAKYKIKPVLGFSFSKGAQQQFILIAKNNKGFQNINVYLSTFLQDSQLQIPETAPNLEDIFVIYPYIHKKIYQLKGNEFLGIKPKDLNHLKFSKWNSLRNKFVVLQNVSFQEKPNFNTDGLLRAIENNTFLSKLPKSELAPEMDKMLPYQELCNSYDELPKHLNNTEAILERCQIDFDFSNDTTNSPPCFIHNQAFKTTVHKPKSTLFGINHHSNLNAKPVIST